MTNLSQRFYIHHIYLYFFLNIIVKIKVTAKAPASAAVTDHHTPSIPIRNGIIRMAEHWNTKVRINEIIAETMPSFNAVNRHEPNIQNPEIRNENEKRWKPLTVRLQSSVSYPTNICAIGSAAIFESINIQIPHKNNTVTLFLKIFLSSE